MKVKYALVIFVVLSLSCQGATLKYYHRPYSSITAAKPLVIDFQGAYLEPDSGKVMLSILGTMPNFKSFFGMPFDTFFTRSINVELDSVRNWSMDKKSPVKLRFVVERFLLNYKIDDIGEQSNGIRYEYIFDCDVKGRVLINMADSIITVPVKGKRHSRWFLYLWGAWQPTLQDELDIMFSQMAEELVKGVVSRFH